MSFSWAPFGPALDDQPEPPARTLSNKPARGLAVLTCMDCRIDPLGAFGIAVGDAVVLRNAGAQWSDDVARSLRLSLGLGVTQVQVVAHTGCAAFDGDDAAAEAGARRTADRIQAAIPELEADAAVLDLATGVSRRVAAPPPSG